MLFRRHLPQPLFAERVSTVTRYSATVRSIWNVGLRYGERLCVLISACISLILLAYPFLAIWYCTLQNSIRSTLTRRILVFFSQYTFTSLFESRSPRILTFLFYFPFNFFSFFFRSSYSFDLTRPRGRTYDEKNSRKSKPYDGQDDNCYGWNSTVS